ncbi:MAG: site-specific integrase [Bacteroidota bacterium]|nr:site-specific integrase [Bacteroidota bacterium]
MAYFWEMNIPQIAVLLNWRKEQNIKGRYSVYLRITIDRIAKYYKIAVPKSISEEEWAGKDDAWVKPIHPFAFEINNKIVEKKLLIHELIKRYYNLNKPLTFPIIFQQLKRRGDCNSFVDYMKAYIRTPPEKLHENTIKKYQTCLQHLTKFRSNFYFNDIDQSFVHEFYKYLQVALNLGGTTIKKYFDAFKKVIKAAHRENYIHSSQMEFLFDDVKISSKRITKRVYLEIDEIKKLKALKFPEEKKYLERDRDIFLLQIYTGYYYKDLQIFSKEQLIKDEEFGYFIIGSRDKNGNETIIPLFKFPYAMTIIDKYAAGEESKMIFKSDTFIQEQAYNRNLKDIAKLAGLTKTIFNKVGRHTNAQLWVRYGAERPILSKMLGHEKEETTGNYYNVNIPEIVEGTKKVDFERLGI